MRQLSRFIYLAFFSLTLSSCANTQIVLSGYVRDSQTNIPIPNAIVTDMSYGDGCYGVTDESGRYSYTTFCEEHSIIISAPGYKKSKYTLMTPFIPNQNPICLDVFLNKE